MTKRPWQKWYWGDWEEDTSHLNNAEKGAYMNLMSRFWRKSEVVKWHKAEEFAELVSPLPDDDRVLSRFARVPLEEWKQHLRPVLEPFFVLDAGFWFHPRQWKDINSVVKTSVKNKASGRTGGLKTQQRLREVKAIGDLDSIVALAKADAQANEGTNASIDSKTLDQTLENTRDMSPVCSEMPAMPVFLKRKRAQ